MKSHREDSKEYAAFVAGQGISPPPALDRAVRETVARELSPPIARVFAKLGAAHLMASAFTLSVCPQFQFRLVGEGHGLMGVFMDAFGPVGCTIACGIFFMSASAALAMFVLSRDEARSLRRWEMAAVASLLLPSLGFFLLIGVMRGILSPVDFLQLDTGVWALSGWAGGWVTLRSGLRLRLQTL